MLRRRMWRMVLQRARAEGPVVVAAWLLLVCATTLLAAAVVYSDAVSLSGLRHALAQSSPADRTVEVDTSTAPGDIGRLDGLVRPLVGGALQPTGGEVALMVRADGFASAGSDPADTTHLTSLASFEGLPQHAQLLSGAWPSPGQRPIEAALSEGAARALGLTVDSEVDLTDRLESGLTVHLRVTGIWRPDPSDAYWQQDPLALNGIVTSGPSTTRGPFAVAQQDLAALPVTHKEDLRWLGLLDVAAARPEQLDALQANLTGLSSAVRAALPPEAGFTSNVALATVLAATSQAILVARGAILILALQFAVVAGYAVVLVGGILVDRRRSEVALLRSRGTSAAQLAAIALVEAALLAGPAILVAPLLAVGVVRLLGSVGPLAASGVVDAAGVTAGSVVAALLAGVICAAALMLPTVTSGLDRGAVRAALGRQIGASLPQRLGLDIALLAVAALAIWQLHLYGAPLTRSIGGTLGLDPLLVAAPALALVAGSLMAVRLVPRVVEVAERVLVRRRDLVPGYGARQLARRPLRYTRAVLLIVLAVALGTFAAAYEATWTRSQADQATFQAAADERIIVSAHPDLPPWALGTAYRSLPGVRVATPVFDQELEVGGAVIDGQLQAVDPAVAARLVTFPPDPADGSTPAGLIPSLSAERPPPTGLDLPAQARSLGVTLEADLGSPSPNDRSRLVALDGAELDLAAVFDGPDGLVRIQGPVTTPRAASQRYEIPLTVTVGGSTLPLGGPLRLQAVEFTVTAPPNGGEVAGSLTIQQLATTVADTGGSWQALPFDGPAGGLTWQLVQASGTTPLTSGAAGPGQVLIGAGGPRLVLDPEGEPSATVRLWAAPNLPTVLPALVSDSFLAQTGARVGDTVRATSLGYPVALKVIGRTAAMPPLDPTGADVLVDAASLQAMTFSEMGRLATPQEWWLQTDPGSGPALEATLAGPPYSAASVIGRVTLTESLTDAPVALGPIGALFLGTVVALAIAAIGFVVSATISVEERLAEFALLRALGVSIRAVSSWLLVENACLMVFSLLMGTALGALLAWLVLPFASFTADGTAPVPAAALLVPWQSLIPVYAVVAAALIVTAVIVRRQLERDDISGRLRTGDA
jgi:hypothetical protein